MSMIEELRSLDPRDPGRWPLAARAGAVGVCFLVLTIVLAYVFVWDEQRPNLQRSEDTEQTLRQEFKTKHAKAVNLDVYKQQLKDIEHKYPGLEVVNVGQVVGTPQAVILEQLERFAAEVMPAFKRM